MYTAKLIQRIKLRNSIEILDFMNKSQYWPEGKIREYQFNKLKNLINHAARNVPYYMKLFSEIELKPEEIKSFTDVKNIPILTKELIRENFNDLIASNYEKNKLIPNSTGGSTGEPLKYYQDINYENWADAARVRGCYNIAGCNYGDSTAVIWGAMHEVKEDFTLYERVRDYLMSGVVYLNAFNLSDSRKMEFIKLCRLIRPKLLRGYFTAIKDFAHFINEEKLWFPKVKGVILGAETVDSETQKFIEKVFKAPSYNTYGGRELSLIAMECECKNGLHEVSENNYVEYEKTDIQGYEDAGNLIITNLNNYAMPFIRYRIGDIGILGRGKTCECGRGLPLISKVIGRTTEIFVFHDGTRIAGEMFIHLMKDFPIREYQFIQTSETQIILRLKRSDNVGIEVREKILNKYKNYLPDGVQIVFEEVDSFEKTKTGKFRFVYKQ